MRKIIVFNFVSLDGFYARPNGEIDWHNVDDEFNTFAVEQTKSFYTILFGRVTYQLFESFWPKAEVDPSTSTDDLEIAKSINTVEKIVFSKTLKTVEENAHWKKVKLLYEITPEIIKSLKEESGGDIVIFGSGTIVQALTNLGSIDEYRLMINPVILGKGKSLFTGVHHVPNLQLQKTKVFKNGNVLLTYTKKS